MIRYLQPVNVPFLVLTQISHIYNFRINLLKCIIAFSRGPIRAFTILHYTDGDIDDIFEKVDMDFRFKTEFK